MKHFNYEVAISDSGYLSFLEASCPATDLNADLWLAFDDAEAPSIYWELPDNFGDLDGLAGLYIEKHFNLFHLYSQLLAGNDCGSLSSKVVVLVSQDNMDFFL